jgi:hypothetical protein
MNSIDFDMSEVRNLSADLTSVGSKVAPLARKAVEVTARHVKDDARSLMKGVKGMPHIPRSVDYDMVGSAAGIGADIGFDKGGQGSLGNIYEYGSRYFPARGPLTHALHENEADFVKGIMLAAEEALS